MTECPTCGSREQHHTCKIEDKELQSRKRMNAQMLQFDSVNNLAPSAEYKRGYDDAFFDKKQIKQKTLDEYGYIQVEEFKDLVELVRELKDNCFASLAESDVSDHIKDYRRKLHERAEVGYKKLKDSMVKK